MIGQTIMGRVQGGWLNDVPEEERDQIIEQTKWQMKKAYGLHQPFKLRSALWLLNGLTFNLGETFLYAFFEGVWRGANQAIQAMVLQRLPYTLLLVGVSNILILLSEGSWPISNLPPYPQQKQDAQAKPGHRTGDRRKKRGRR